MKQDETRQDRKPSMQKPIGRKFKCERRAPVFLKEYYNNNKKQQQQNIPPNGHRIKKLM